MSSVKTSDVTKALRDLVNMSMLFSVDDENYVIVSPQSKAHGPSGEQPSERATISIDGQPAPIILYQEQIRDQTAQLLNPFAEGVGQPPTSHWLFRVIKVGLLGRLKTIMEVAIKSALEEKSKAKKTDAVSDLPMVILAISSTIIDEVDDKTLDEIKTIFSNKYADELLKTYYDKRTLRHNVSSGLYDPEVKDGPPTFKSRFPNVRKKTWVVVERLLLKILECSSKDKLDDYSRSADSTTCPRLSSFLSTILALYKPINNILCHINDGEESVDLSMLAYHIRTLPAYADNARFMVQPYRDAETKQATAAPAAPAAPAYMEPPGSNMMPAPTYADGWQPPPMPMPMVPGGYPMPAQQPWYAQAPVPQPTWNMWQQPQNIQQPMGGIVPPFDGPYRWVSQQPQQPLGLVPGMPPGVYRT